MVDAKCVMTSWLIGAVGEMSAANRVIIPWVCAILDEGGGWHHWCGITSRGASVPL
jgi:hypothetical protein